MDGLFTVVRQSSNYFVWNTYLDSNLVDFGKCHTLKECKAMREQMEVRYGYVFKYYRDRNGDTYKPTRY